LCRFESGLRHHLKIFRDPARRTILRLPRAA
jgi:hypothetical protein